MTGLFAYTESEFYEWRGRKKWCVYIYIFFCTSFFQKTYIYIHLHVYICVYIYICFTYIYILLNAHVWSIPGWEAHGSHACNKGRKKRVVCAIYLWFGDDCVDNLNCLCIRSIKMGMWWMWYPYLYI